MIFLFRRKHFYFFVAGDFYFFVAGDFYLNYCYLGRKKMILTLVDFFSPKIVIITLVPGDIR
jgi:hypothetical protein